MTQQRPPIDLPGRTLTRQELESLVREVAGRPELWERDLDWASGERVYAEVFTSEHVGVWAIGWAAEDHDTGFHDHDTSCGAVCVARGRILHEHLRLGDGLGTICEAVPEGGTFTFDDTAIHRMRFQPGGPRTVTVHAYSPPLERTGQYDNGDDDILHRLPTSSAEPLRPHLRLG